jgi:hypothetical protein
MSTRVPLLFPPLVLYPPVYDFVQSHYCYPLVWAFLRRFAQAHPLAVAEARAVISQMPPDAIAGFGSGVNAGGSGGGGGGGGAKRTGGTNGMDVDGDEDFMDAIGAPSCPAEGKDEWNGDSGGAKDYK